MAGVPDAKNVHIHWAGEQARDRRFRAQLLLGPRLGPLAVGTELGLVTEWQLEGKASGSHPADPPTGARHQAMLRLGAAAEALR